MAPRLLFFVGKGGVGKSTLSALAALAQTDTDRSVFLLSLDPAHNQSDLFARRFGDTPIQINEKLSVMEADIERWIARYLREVQEKVQQNYRYLTAFNLEHHVRVLRHSPGLEEFALQLVLDQTLTSQADRDVIIIDMPPTALTTRFFASPSLARNWNEQLLKLRREIKKRREMITTMRVGQREFEQDRVLRILEKDLARNKELSALYADPDRSVIHLVLNPDPLSWYESQRLRERLKELGIHPGAVVLNKSGNEDPALPRELSDLPLITVPALRQGPVGEDALRSSLAVLPRKTRQVLAEL